MWTNSSLLPNLGISRAFNPQMRVTHQTVRYLDEQDAPVSKTSSILSIIWWEEAQYGQARLASLFLDENAFDPANLSIYDLPVLTGGGSGEMSDEIPSGAYLFPSLQADGLTGAFLISFADSPTRGTRSCESRSRTTTETFRAGKPQVEAAPHPDRGHRELRPIARSDAATAPGRDEAETPVGTSIGSGYGPTFHWRDGDLLKYSRLEGAEWAAVRSIAIDAVMTYEKALALVTGMGTRN